MQYLYYMIYILILIYKSDSVFQFLYVKPQVKFDENCNKKTCTVNYLNKKSAPKCHVHK